MQSFLSRCQAKVKGILSGFDRVRFRGTLRLLANVPGLMQWLSYRSVRLKEFKDTALEMTDTIKQATQQLADEAGRPLLYLASSGTRKEDVARQIAAADGITEGLVCVLTCVEPCRTFSVGPNRQARKLELRSVQGKCLHQYFYLIDPHWGPLHVRLQTWFPFTVHVAINGREWLARELIRRGIAFEQRDNCFVDIAEVARAQQLMDGQLRTNWSQALDRLLQRVHPSYLTLFGPRPRPEYYWSADETEWATDVMFDSPEDLDRVSPQLVRHAMTTFGSADVLRFLGKRPHVGKFSEAEILSHLGARHEGVRIKHVLERNSIKMYDKQDLVLRVETTINNPRHIKVYRAAENDPDGPLDWRPLRKGVADLHRRAQVSQAANERYLAALASVEAEPTLAEHTRPVCRRTTENGRSVRALNPLAEDDARLLESVSRGEFALHGFRNRDLCRLLFPEDSPLTDKQRMTKVTRLIRLLRAHGLVRKVPKTHRYQLTKRGQDTIPAVLAARAAKTRKLSELAV